ncbi:hypothetical protein D0466_08285 [Peribacillus glennii]|uniref:Aminotransferase class V-fold PLP-dependent enzyme n=1 Tax=Peribacillus glennii TaxID=2303991 RepID=A0A372LHT8_9BACI|nr:hypothetical protein D0466_08285 [Peribacillus glennii]
MNKNARAIGRQDPSKTLTAIGKSDKAGKGLIRISLGKDTTQSDINGLACTIFKIVKEGIWHQNSRGCPPAL